MRNAFIKRILLSGLRSVPPKRPWRRNPVYAGGIAGFALGATLAACHASGSVEARGHNSSVSGVGGYPALRWEP